METSRLTANMKQKYAKQHINQQKQFGYQRERLFWSFPVCILFLVWLVFFCFFFYYINYPEFWNKSCSETKRKQTEGKCQRRPPRASNHVIHFPTDVIFSNRKQPEVGISQEAFTVMHQLFVEGEKTIFLPKSRPSITSLQGSLYSGIPFDIGTFRALQTAGATKSFPTGWEQPGFHGDWIPTKQWSIKNSTGSTSPSPACPSPQPGWGCPTFPRCWSLLLPSDQANTENPPFALCGWQQNSPSLEKVHAEVGRKILFNSILT